MFSLIGEFISTLIEDARAFISIINEAASFFFNASLMMPSFLVTSFTLGVAALIVLAILNR